MRKGKTRANGFLLTVTLLAVSCLILGGATGVLAAAGDILRVNTDSAGTQAVGGDSFIPYLNPDGRYVVFDSDATNLVQNDTNGLPDVFRKDTSTGAAVRCSTDSSDAQGNGASLQPAINQDGRYIVFESDATNLVANDTNGVRDIFRKDLLSGETLRCSTDAAGTQADGASNFAVASADGVFVTFASDATNLVTNDTNGASDIFRKNLVTQEIVRCSTSSASVQSNGNSQGPILGPEGRFVAFTSQASNLVPNDTNGVADVFRKDLLTGETLRCSTNSTGGQSNGISNDLFLGADGRFVVFRSDATNLVPNDTNGVGDVFLKDIATGETSRCSTDSAGVQANGASDFTAISDDGRYAVFRSDATNLVPGDTNGVGDIFRKDMLTGQVIRCSTDAAGAQANGASNAPICDAAGRYIAFTSAATNLVANDTNGLVDVFRKELALDISFYFAEGTCRTGFQPFITVLNPEATQAQVSIQYMLGNGTTQDQPLVVPPTTRLTVMVNSLLGTGDDLAHDFSARVDCTNGIPVTAERPIYFDYGGWTGGSCVVGARAPSTSWYFAEGTCRPGFDPYFCIQNPGAVQADVRIEYMLGDATTSLQGVLVPAHSRVTMRACDFLGVADDAAHDFSARITSAEPVVAERPMYFDYFGWQGGDCVMGSAAPAANWYFAEGTTRPGFDPYICVQNPGATRALVRNTYMPRSGTPVEQLFNVEPHSRLTVPMVAPLGRGDDIQHDFATKVESLNGAGIVCERPMYFDYFGMQGGSCVMGTVAPATSWYFSEGSVRPGFVTYITLSNPESVDGGALIRYIQGDGTVIETLSASIGAGSRFTLDADARIPRGSTNASDFSLVILSTSGVRLVVERPMYFSALGVSGGDCVMGYVR